MSKINWKVRFKNRTFLLSLWALLVVFAQQVASIFGMDITVYSVEATNLFETALMILALLGIVHDPTTKGIGDSDQALTYREPKGDE